ncbi:MAG: HD domain-containing protein [Actinobacteria bacterium]|nr:HD domain-containing protein [Actinomycetota bacterium]
MTSSRGAHALGWGVLLTGITLGVALVTMRPPELLTSSPQAYAVVLFAAVTIALADSRPFVSTGTRDLTPVGLAVSMALGMTAVLPGGESVSLTGGSVILVVALSAAAGAWLRQRGDGRAWTAAEWGMRMLTVSLVVGLTRVPLPGGGPLLAQEGTDREGWVLALCLVGVATIAVGVQGLLGAALRSTRERIRLRHAVVEEAITVGPLAVGVVSSAVMVALATGVLGAVAVPVFILPLVLLVLAVQRQSVVRAAQHQTVYAVSHLTDEGGFTAPGHAARVAQLSVQVGRELGMSERELRELEWAALLHDIGQVSLERPIPRGATVHISTLDQRRLASTGAALLSRTAELSRLATIVAQQATPFWWVVQIGGIPVAARILRVVNAYDDLADGAQDDQLVVAALERLRRGAGYDYDPDVLDLLCRILHREGRLSREALSLLSG